jgi:3-phosphoshikimate 1-carboxyvinyltransferase
VKARFEPARALRGELRAPPDKSISHRAALVGAMASEPVRVDNYLKAADTRATREAARALGALVEVHLTGIVLRGTGLHDAREPGRPIDVGNAGTLMRLLPGWLAGQQGRSFTLDGDASIRRRPVDRVMTPLRAMGAALEAVDDRYPPLTVHGSRLRAISYELPVPSAQVKSCLLFAGLLAEGVTTIDEPLPSRDHTERMLLRAGAAIERAGTRISVGRADELALERIVVPGDVSSAAYFVAAGVLVGGSRLLLQDVGVNWTRTGFLRILERMGGIVLGDLEPLPPELAERHSGRDSAASRATAAQAEPVPRRGAGATQTMSAGLVASEPVSDLDVAAGLLEGTTVEPDEVPLAIDELPLVALLGCFAEGETVVRGAGELRIKESDRIATVVHGLRGLGADIEATEDGFAVRGGGGLRGGTIDAHGDHRLAMLGAIAGLASREGVEVDGIEAAAISYPRFVEDLRSLLGA